MRYLDNVAYAGVVNVSPQAYANSLFELKPGWGVIVKAEIAARVVANAAPSLALMDEAVVARVVARGLPEVNDEHPIEAFLDEAVPDPPAETDGGDDSSTEPEVVEPLTPDVEEPLTPDGEETIDVVETPKEHAGVETVETPPATSTESLSESSDSTATKSKRGKYR